MTEEIYDIGIIGGGLAGLALAIESAKAGRKVILFEKETFPYHKVCGEYISNESWNYIKSLGVDLDSMNLPKINQLKISSAEGNELNQKLNKGGFGISRYMLDHKLANIAKELGVHLLENTKVEGVSVTHQVSIISTSKYTYRVQLAVGAHGKRSVLDKKLNRAFISKAQPESKNYVGIKYHVKAQLPDNLIGLHLFKNGYCGISKVEGNDRFCFCYLTLASNLKNSGNIKKMEDEILSKNEYLKEYLSYERYYEQPLVISQINFARKTPIEDGVFMVGDAAGLIVPLCGNGMSMALKAAHEFHTLSELFFSKQFSKEELARRYITFWNAEFGSRLSAGRLLQKLFYNKYLVNPMLKLLDKTPWITTKIIQITHGKDIV
ncbi:MAG: flavin-dependent dehydrogenase [Vicingaceae bacterium]|jgi:flavin-dependent dehydrogenase